METMERPEELESHECDYVYTVVVLAGRTRKWHGLWIADGLSVVIEAFHLITARGLREFDDVMHNMIGA